MTTTTYRTALGRRTRVGTATFAELLDQAHRDADAFEELTRRLRPLAASCAIGCGVRDTDIDDIIQETWIRLHRHLRTIHTATSLPGWIATTARRLAWSSHRNHRPRCDLALVEHMPDLDADPTRDMERAADGEAVRAALKRLPVRDRAVLAMTVLADDPLPYKAISVELNCAIGSIGMFRQRSLTKVARHLSLDTVHSSTDWPEHRSDRGQRTPTTVSAA